MARKLVQKRSRSGEKNLTNQGLNMLKSLRHLPIFGSFVTMLLMLPCISLAGGLYLNEFGTPSMGVAGAGTHAVASDASTSFHNAAEMRRIKGNELMGSGGLLNAN